MAFKKMGIDFAKRLWEDHRIKYGPRDSYCDYPRRWRTRGIRTNERTGKEEIVQLEFIYYKKKNGEGWISIEKGGVTGYESAPIERLLIGARQKKDWLANMGGMGYDKLLIRHKDYGPMIREMIK